MGQTSSGVVRASYSCVHASQTSSVMVRVSYSCVHALQLRRLVGLQSALQRAATI